MLGLAFRESFRRGQEQVSRDYGSLMASKLMGPATLVRSPGLDRIIDLVTREVCLIIDGKFRVALSLLVLVPEISATAKSASLWRSACSN